MTLPKLKARDMTTGLRTSRVCPLRRYLQHTYTPYMVIRLLSEFSTRILEPVRVYPYCLIKELAIIYPT